MQQGKILIFNPFGIGDVLFTTPLLRNLKENIPAASITYLCNRRTYPLLVNNRFVDKTLIFEKDEWRDLAKKSRWAFLKEFSAFFQKIRKEKFDIIFDLSLNSQYGLFFKIAGIKTRLGFNFKNRGRFLTHKLDIPAGYREKHVARYYLGLLKFLNLPVKDYKFNLFLSEENAKRTEIILESYGLNKSNFLAGVCSGSGDSWQDTAYFKRWPKENFLRICRYLQEEFKAKIILFGSEVEASICEYIYNSLSHKPLNLCGKLKLDEFFSLLDCCALVITNDGGPFHIAQALKKKTVVFFGPVDERVYGVYPQADNCLVLKKDIPCRPCYRKFKFKGCPFDKRCLRDITIDEAMEAVNKLIVSS